MFVIPLLASLSLFLSLLVCLLSWHLSFLVWVFLKCLVVCEYVLFYVMWSVLLSVNAFSFYESLLPVIMGRGVEITTKNVMLVFWTQNSSFFSWIYPALLSQRPTVTAPTIWMDWRATSWHPHRHSQPISFTFNLRSPPLPGECVASRLGAAQDPLPISQSSLWAFDLACACFHSSSSVCQHFSRISQHFKSSSITPPIFLWILFCFLKMFIYLVQSVSCLVVSDLLRPQGL